MKRKLLFAAIMAVMGVGQSFAYDTTNLTSAGWQLVDGTTVTLTDVNDYYYLFVAGNHTDQALVQISLGRDYRPYYHALQDPSLSVGQVWVLEATDNSRYIMSNKADGRYLKYNNEGWDSSMGTDASTADYEFALSDGKYHIRHSNDRALGPWDGVNYVLSAQGWAQTATNKSGNDDVGFYVYRIARNNYTPFSGNNFANAGWKRVDASSDWGRSGLQYVFLDVSETGYESNMAMTATDNGLPQYAFVDMANTNQYWLTEVSGSGYAFKSVGVGKYSNYTAPWGGDMSEGLPGNVFKPTYISDGKWHLQNTAEGNTSNWLGRWGDGNSQFEPFVNENLAANKGLNDGSRQFLVYAIPTTVNMATALPANGDMAANIWYYFDIDVAGNSYAATATSLADIQCVSYETGSAVTLEATNNSLAATRYYVKSTTDNHLEVAATSYSYNISAAVANPANAAYIQPGQTITVTYTCSTDAPNTTPTVDFTGVTFNGNTVSVTPDGTSFTFTVPANITYDTDYVLSIPAGAVSYGNEASSALATFTYHTPYFWDGTYYMRNTDTNYADKYIARGGAWATRAYVEDYGLAVNLTLNDGKYSIQCFDNERWLGDDGEVFTDCTGNRVKYFTAEKVEGGFKFKRADNAYLAVNNDGVVIANGGSDDATNVWALETPAVYTASCYARNAQKQVVAAATAAGLTGITTGADLEAAFNNTMEITIPTINRQEKYNQQAPEVWEGTPRDLLAEQTVTGLADGVYKLSFKGMQRAASYARVDAAEGARGMIYAYANDVKTQLKSVMEEGAADAYDSDYESSRTGLHYPNSENSTYAAFDAGLYDNEIYVYVTGGTLTFGIKNPSRTPDNGASWAVFGDFTLTYYSNSYSYLIGEATASPASGSIISAGQTITVNFTATTNHPSATPTVDFSGVTVNGSAAAVTTSSTGFTFTVPADAPANTIYKLVIPAGAVQFTGEASSEAATFTYGTAVANGNYYLYNAKTGKYLAPSGNGVQVTDAGEPVSWEVNNDGNSPIKFIKTNKYVNGRWWAELSDDARAFVLVVSDEPGLEGFKLKKINPDDYSNGEPYEYLYISGVSVAANGRYQNKENPDNFNDWAYAVWQFIPAISETDASLATVQGANVRIDRTLVGGQWNGFSVPFTFTVAGSALEGASVKKFSSVTDNEITLQDATTIEAGKPYLVQPATDDIVNPSFSGVTEWSTTEVTEGTGSYTFQAHLFATDLATDGSVAYVSTSDSSIKKLTSGSIKGLRSIFNIPVPTPSNPVKALVIHFEDSADGILTVDAEGNITEGEIYNLAGQRMNAPQKGVNIINGKKVLVK